MTRERRLGEFRLRLLVAFGIGTVPGLLIGGEVEAIEQVSECFVLDPGQLVCPTGDDAMKRLDAQRKAVGVTADPCISRALNSAPAILGESGNCCYAVDVTNTCERPPCTSCYGRPYVANAEVVSAPVIGNRAWGSTAVAQPDLSKLGSDQRAALVEFWSDNARAEHSSIAGFHRFALDLFAHGAPPELLDRCIRAAADELAHARLCFSLASHYADEPLGPGPMPLGDSAPIARSLVALAVATAREGCLAESSAAWLAGEVAIATSDPIVRAVLERIAHEEAEHAELAWMTLRWAIETGGPEVRAAVAEVFASARAIEVGGAAIGVPEHGMLDAREVQAIVDQGFARLLVPIMRAAMAA